MPKTPEYFHDKTLFVTGSASGIGRAAALVFAREGARVICTDIDAEGNQRTVNQIVQQGGEAEAIELDV